MQINKIGIYIILALPLFTFSPWMYPADFPKTIIFRSILAILGFLFIWQALHKKEDFRLSNLKNNKIILALVALFIVYFLASIFSVDPYFSFWGSPWRGGGFISFVFYFIFAILTFILFKKENWQKAWDFSIIIGTLVSLVAIFQYFSLLSNIFLPMPNRPYSTIGNPILLAIYLLLLFFLTLSFFIKEPFKSNQNKIKKIFYGLSVLIFIFTIFISSTRAVWAGIVIGLLYFLLLYIPYRSQDSKKPLRQNFLNLSKMIAGLFILAIVIVVAYVNLFPSQTQTSQQNRILQTLENRLSIKNALNDERYQGWKVAFQAIQNKPILGWGPENFAVGFDRHYDPKIISSFWWDKAHNIILDTGAQTGILGIIAYLALFGALFYELNKSKHADKKADINADNTLIIHGVQATLIGYFVANFFSFDSFSTYLIFFLLIGYALHLTSLNNAEINAEQYAENTLKNKSNISEHQRLNQRKISGKKIVIGSALILIIFFIYQYNLKPFLINKDLNRARELVNQKDCFNGLSLIENTLTKHSFLNSYIRMEYAELAKKCGDFYPLPAQAGENNLTYIKRGKELITEAVKIQPLYTRYWIYLGNASSALATTEKNPVIKKELLNQANLYLEKALESAPKHQEIIIEQSKVAIISGEFQKAKEYSEKCINLNPNYANCYWQLALSQIYSKDINLAQKNIQIAKEKGYNIDSKTGLNQLSDAYGSIQDYENLVIVYNKLITLIDPNTAQYHSSLAFFYKQLRRFKEARQEALITLQLSPESKPAVDAFLKTLPLN